MIDIKLYEKDHKYKILCKGHAEYAEHGKDIVCSAVSTLLQTFGNYLIDKEKFRSWVVCETKFDAGDLIVWVVDPKDSVKDMYYMIVDGLENIQFTYPECVSIEYNPEDL